MVHPTDAKESSIHHASIASTSAPDSSIESLAIGKRDGGPAPILAPPKKPTKRSPQHRGSDSYSTNKPSYGALTEEIIIKGDLTSASFIPI